MFYYQPEFSYLRVSNLFVNGGISPNLYSQLGAPRYDKIPNDTPSRLRDPNGGPLNTQFRVYLVAYFPDVPNCGARIVDAYDRQSVSALLALNDKLLLILPPEAQSAEEISRPEQMEASGETQDECAIIDLPPLPEDGSQYALIARYGRSYPLLYFYRAVAKNASGEQYRRWTLAQTNPRGIQFYEGDNPEPVTPDAAFNTLKFAYLVRILPQSLPFGNGVPSR